MTFAAVAGAIFVAAVVLHLLLAVFTPLPRRALRVLMYHRVTEGPGDRFTLPVGMLRRQIGWMQRRGYTLVSLPEVVASLGGKPLPARSVLLSFDDGTADALEFLAPLLGQLGVRGALFAVPGWAGTVREEGGRRDRILDAAGLRAVGSSLDLGLHGHTHRDLRTLTLAEVEAELGEAAAWLRREGIPFQPALAYPYGAYPRKDPAGRAAFLAAVRRAGVEAAFRIGNRVNPLPLLSPLEIYRTEIQGDEPFWAFAWKLRTGRRRAL